MNYRKLIVIGMALALGGPAWAATVLTFDVTSHSQAGKGVKPGTGGALPADAHYTQTVTLSRDWLRIDEPDTMTNYDFVKSRIERFNKRDKTYDDSSLYTFIGANVAEFLNRMTLGKALAAGKIKDNPMSRALTENLMSLSELGSDTIIDSTVKQGETVFSWNGQLLMSVSRGTRDQSAAVLAQYLRFLRYSTGGHPQILTAIERGRGIPERLTVVRSNIVVETRTLVLQNMEERTDEALSFEGYKRKAPEGEPFATLGRISPSPAAELEARAVVLHQERDTAATAGRIFDAMLANFAAMLAIGDVSESTAWISAHRQQLSADSDAQSLMTSLAPHDAASATSGAETIEKMAQAAGPHSYVLNIFAADTRVALNERDKAIDHFLAALAVDPTITGAWIDLGTAYAHVYREYDAWACWDAARALRPGHYMLKVVDDAERKLRADHPEFF